MEKESIAAVMIGAAAVATVGAVAFATYKKETAAALEIIIYDQFGNPVPRNSPLELVEGDPYTIVVKITNTSTKKGVPWSATLITLLTVNGAVPAGLIYLVDISDVYSYGPNESRQISQAFTVPLGFGGYAGGAAAYLTDPDAVELDSVVDNINYIIVPIVYNVGMILDVLDINSVPVGGSPVKVTEDDTYFVRLSVVNNCTKAGVPWPIKLTAWITVFDNGNQVRRAGWVADYAGSEQILQPLTEFLMPLGTGGPEPSGNPGHILIEIKDFGTAALLGSVIKPLAIIEVPIDYGGDIIWS